MSGRIRTIKPELLDDTVTARLSSVAFRTFISLLVLADDYGNFRAEPRFLEGKIFWAVDPEKSIEEVLAEIEDAKLVTFYSVRGQRYGSIRTWAKNQRVQKIGQPHVPGPNEADGLVESGLAASASVRARGAPCGMDSGDSPESLRADARGTPESLRPDLDLDLDPYLDLDQQTNATLVASESGDSGSLAGDSAKESKPAQRETSTQLALAQPSAPAAPNASIGPPFPAQHSVVPPEISRGSEREVFEYWLARWRGIVHGSRAPALDGKRRRKIRARLAEGFAVDDLKQAIDGLWASAWHVENGRTDIELVCRDAGHVEQFMGMLAPDVGMAGGWSMPERDTHDARSSEEPNASKFVPPPAELFEAMESARRAVTPGREEPGAPVRWKGKPTDNHAPASIVEVHGVQ